MTPEQTRDELLRRIHYVRYQFATDRQIDERIMALIDELIDEARADERRNIAERLTGRCDENEKWLRDEVITDDGFAQTIGLSVVRDMRGLAARSARETGGGQP